MPAVIYAKFSLGLRRGNNGEVPAFLKASGRDFKIAKMKEFFE